MAKKLSPQGQEWINELLEIMTALRHPETGCPWDLEQDHKSLKPYLVEESAEVLDAIDNNDMENLKEELGDVLLNVVFHAQLGKEAGHFDFHDVAESISEKMTRRHPHIFSDEVSADDADEVIRLWEETKKQEKIAKGISLEKQSLLDNVPSHLPPLRRTQKTQKKASKVGFDWDDWQGPYDKVLEELEEVKEAIEAKNKAEIEAEIGDLLFSVVNLSRKLKVDADEALNSSRLKFARRFQEVEKSVASSGKSWDTFSLEELDKFWDKAKEAE